MRAGHFAGLRPAELGPYGSLFFFCQGPLSAAPKLGIPELGLGHRGAPTPRLVAMTHGSTSAERHCQGWMQTTRSRV